MKRSELNSIGECYKEAFHASRELAIPAAAFLWSVFCIFFMPVIWAFFWAITLSDKEDK